MHVFYVCVCLCVCVCVELLYIELFAHTNCMTIYSCHIIIRIIGPLSHEQQLHWNFVELIELLYDNSIFT